MVPGMPPMKMMLPLPLSFLGEPLGRAGAGPVLVDADIVGAGLGHLCVPGDEDHALGAGIRDGAVQRRRRDRPGDDDVGARLDHGVDLLDLGLRVAAGRLHVEFDAILVGAGLGDGAQQVERGVHPGVALEAGADEDLERLRRPRRSRCRRAQRERRQPDFPVETSCSCQHNGSPLVVTSAEVHAGTRTSRGLC